MKEKEIRVFSKGMFILYCKKYEINDFTVDNCNYAIIEILDTSKSKEPLSDHSNGKNTSLFKKSHSNVLVLCFDDIENDIILNGHKFKAMTEKQGKKVYNFINKNIDKDKFIVHCSAGISRSGAIGRFINDYLLYNNFTTYFPEQNNIIPNGVVSRILNNIINKY